MKITSVSISKYNILWAQNTLAVYDLSSQYDGFAEHILIHPSIYPSIFSIGVVMLSFRPWVKETGLLFDIPTTFLNEGVYATHLHHARTLLLRATLCMLGHDLAHIYPFVLAFPRTSWYQLRYHLPLHASFINSHCGATPSNISKRCGRLPTKAYNSPGSWSKEQNRQWTCFNHTEKDDYVSLFLVKCAASLFWAFRRPPMPRVIINWLCLLLQTPSSFVYAATSLLFISP